MTARKQGQHQPLYIVLVWSILFSIAPTIQGWKGCVDPENETKKARRGQKTTVCMSVGPANWNDENSAYARYSFKPVTDDYSRFTIPNSYQKFVKDKDVSGLDKLTGDLTVFSSSQTKVSPLRKYYDSQNKHIYPHLTAIIDVKDGKVTGIAWDEACMFCSDSQCKENTFDFITGANKTDILGPTTGCFLTEDDCDKIVQEGGTECDLTLYTVWTGTDEKKNVLASSKFRFSAFTGKQVKDQFRDQLDKFKDIDFPWNR